MSSIFLFHSQGGRITQLKGMVTGCKIRQTRDKFVRSVHSLLCWCVERYSRGSVFVWWSCVVKLETGNHTQPNATLIAAVGWYSPPSSFSTTAHDTIPLSRCSIGTRCSIGRVGLVKHVRGTHVCSVYPEVHPLGSSYGVVSGTLHRQGTLHRWNVSGLFIVGGLFIIRALWRFLTPLLIAIHTHITTLILYVSIKVIITIVIQLPKHFTDTDIHQSSSFPQDGYQ